MRSPARRAVGSLIFAALLCSSVFGCGLRASARTEAAPTVIVLSWDGVRHDMLDDPSFAGLARVQREGTRASALVPVFPSLTFPSHVSLATGAAPSVHGIVANRFWDRERGEFDYSGDASWLEAEPLWIAAERQNVRAATFFWVGSESDWRGRGWSYRRAPFSSRIGEAEKVAQIAEWLALPGAERPGLVMSWWHGADHAGHEEGPDAPEVGAALRAQDAQLQRLLAHIDAAGAWPNTTLVIVSDHGMAQVDRAIDVRGLLRESGIAARVFNSSALAHVFLTDPSRRGQALDVLGQVGELRAHAGDSLPATLDIAHPGRTGDIVVVTDPPNVLSSRSSKRGMAFRLRRLLGGSQGAHGYEPERHESMHGIFLATGRGVAPGSRIGRVGALRVAPTVARLLGIDPPESASAPAIDLSVAPSASPSASVAEPQSESRTH